MPPGSAASTNEPSPNPIAARKKTGDRNPLISEPRHTRRYDVSQKAKARSHIRPAGGGAGVAVVGVEKQPVGQHLDPGGEIGDLVRVQAMVVGRETQLQHLAGGVLL